VLCLGRTPAIVHSILGTIHRRVPHRGMKSAGEGQDLGPRHETNHGGNEHVLLSEAAKKLTDSCV
jgi:hypothetical protein